MSEKGMGAEIRYGRHMESKKKDVAGANAGAGRRRFPWGVMLGGVIGFLGGVLYGSMAASKMHMETAGTIVKKGALELAERNPGAFVSIVAGLEKELSKEGKDMRYLLL